MSRRNKPRQNRLNATALQPQGRMRYYRMPDPEPGEVRPKRKRTYVRTDKHKGLREAYMSGASLSKRSCTKAAYDGSPHHTEVATDDRLRKAEIERKKIEDLFTSRWKLLDPTL